ncbi:MAG: cytochrome c biogenesis protein ResB, partial [Prolixibacteraceae bacterium]|nr:cytochrome c biogenesis protein ResB [Prolixibacteraceae bacterium]
MRKVFKVISSPVFMGALLTMLIVAMAMATFIENDFGTQVARNRVYNAWWFELLLGLTGLNLLLRIFELKLYRIQKLSVFLFHLAFVVMIIGAGVTRYFGYEGTMHIREGESSSEIETNESALSVKITGSNDIPQKFVFKTNIEQKHTFHTSIETGNKQIGVELARYYQGAIKQAVESPHGKKLIGFVLIGDSFRGFQYISSKEVKTLGSLTISFEANTKGNISFFTSGDSLFISSSELLKVKPMQNDAEVYMASGPVLFEKQVVYETAGYNIVFQEYFPSAILEATPAM